MINHSRDEISHVDNSSSDIRMSTWQYHDFVDAFTDDGLSQNAQFKFKKLYENISVNMVALPLVAFPIAWAGNKWLFGRVHRGIGQARLNLIGMAIFYPAAVMWLVSRPVPRKLYTDIITDTSADGTYVREALKQRKPGLWQKISSQLYQLDFDFPQMNQHKGTEFPSNFVASRVQ